ncbi:MAG TPA: hypothetical protein PKN96_12095 [Flavobacterium sp.]|uniref:hypothetical protein n=1 Tax=Flavobacterium sp. TaxID=239 RepID=UPI002BD8574D|nr:hypothetical protein [Flavobacterium sp.]HNP34025.1 hypothetical protein [Flavobacterium sp.]
MKNTIYTVILFFCFHNVNSQNDVTNYILLDNFISTLNPSDNINIYRNPPNFNNQQIFFSKSFLNDYTYPTIGVDRKRVKKLIKVLDFNYMRSQSSSTTDWDFSMSKYSIKNYIENPYNHFDKIKRYKVSKPIFSKDQKWAFIYYEQICGFIDCSSSNVIVFKNCKGKWKLYLNIPISIS